MFKKTFNLHVLSFSLAFILSQDQTHQLTKYMVKKGVYPATGSPTATLLRLHYNYVNYCQRHREKEKIKTFFFVYYFWLFKRWHF